MGREAGLSGRAEISLVESRREHSTAVELNCWKGQFVDEATAEAQLERWRELNARIDWWIPGKTWEDEYRECWRLWEAQDPEFVSLWERTKAWSMEEFHRIYRQLGVRFDIWFYESGVEEEGREIVQELLDKGIAEISEGLPVVKIDEKLGTAPWMAVLWFFFGCAAAGRSVAASRLRRAALR